MRGIPNGQRGIALVIVLLVSMVALTAVVASASVAALGARQTTSLERRSTVALFAAESGLNSILARSRSGPQAFNGAQHASVADWIESVGLDSYTLPGGARVELAVVAEIDDMVTLRSVGIAPDGSRRTILQDFVLEDGLIDPSIFADAALITKPALRTNSRNSRLIGRGIEETEWFFHDRPLADARVGEYVQIGGVRYVVTAMEGGFVDLDAVAPATADSESLAESTLATLIPFAVTADVSSPWFNPTRLPVTDGVVYRVGNTIEVGGARGTVAAVGDDFIDVTWQVTPSATLEEGTPIRRLIVSAISEGGCPPPNTQNLADKLPQGCVERDLGDLFANTFNGASKSEIWEYAQEFGRCCTWPASGTVLSGITWIDNATTGQANSRRLCGEGVVVINTGANPLTDPGSININTDGCEFEGIIYVIGQLGLQGNLDTFSGTIIVEGPGETSVQGGQGNPNTGQGAKALYDPIAIRRALESLPPLTRSEGLVGSLPRTWRFGE